MQITIKLRPAVAEDFKTINGIKKTGVLYFEKSATGIISPFPRYLNEDTDLKQFKILYNKCQIFVAMDFYNHIEPIEN